MTPMIDKAVMTARRERPGGPYLCEGGDGKVVTIPDESGCLTPCEAAALAAARKGNPS